MDVLKAYATTRAPSFVPATWRGTWTDTAGAVTTALDPSPVRGGAITSVSRADASATTPYRIALLRLVSAPLPAQTLAGALQLLFGVRESNAGADFHWHVYAYFTQGDTDTVRAVALADYEEAAGVNEWYASSTANTGQARSLAAAQALAATCQAGDRLVIEIGATARNAVATSYTGQLFYGTQASDGSVSDLTLNAAEVRTRAGFVTFSSPLVLFDNAPLDVTRASVRAVSQSGAGVVDVTTLAVRTVSEVVVAVPVHVTRTSVRTVSANSSAPVEVSRLSVRTVSRQIPPDPCAAPPDGEDLSAADTVRIWDELDRGDGSKTRVAEEPLDDDDDYEGGHKPALLAGVSSIQRALASLAGDYEVGRFSVTRNDPDLTERAAFISAGGRAFHRGTMAVKAASDAARAAHLTPRLLAYGVPDQDPDFDGLTVTYHCRDWVGAAKSLGLNGDALIPKRVFSARDFGDAPRELLDGEHGVPIVLGIRKRPAPVPPPTLSVAAGGSLITGKRYFVSVAPLLNGVEEWASEPASTTLQPAMLTRDDAIDPPHNHSASHMEGSGSLSRYYWTRVTAIDAAGHESPVSNAADVHGDQDPTIGCFASFNLSGTAGVVAYRLYLFNAYNDLGLFDPATNTTNLRPNVPGDPVIVRYKQVAVADLESAWWDETLPGISLLDEDAGIDYLASGGNTIDVAITAVAGATGYRVYCADSPTEASFVRVKQAAGLTASFSSESDGDDAGVMTLPAPAPAGVGRVRLIYAGTEVIGGVVRRRAVVCGHAITSIDKVIYQEGEAPAVEETSEPADMLWPRGVKWNIYFPVPYRDLLGTDGVTRRYTILYLDGARGDAFAAGTATIDVECHGLEDVGDGLGDTLTDQHDQAVALLNYFVLGGAEGYTSGVWPMPPVFPGTSVCQVNRPSFRALKALRQSQLAGGYPGGGVIGAGGERVTTIQLLKQIQQSAAYQLGMNRFWQIAASALDPDDNPATYDVLDDEQDIHRETLVPRLALGDLANELPYEFAPTTDGTYGGTGTARDVASIGTHGPRRGELLSMPFAQSPGVAAHAVGQTLLQTAVLAWYVDFEGEMRLGQYDLGAGFGLIHYRGVGTTGPVARPFRVVRVVMLPGARRYRLTGRDVGEILG